MSIYKNNNCSNESCSLCNENCKLLRICEINGACASGGLLVVLEDFVRKSAFLLNCSKPQLKIDKKESYRHPYNKITFFSVVII